MPVFAANLTNLFTERPFLDRFQTAADHGFQAVEILFPYDDAASEIVRRLVRAGLPLALINTPPPNWTGGEPGFAAIPGDQDRFRRDFKRTLRFAERLKPRHIRIMAGPADGPDARATLIENLAWAAAQAPRQSLTIKPLSPRTTPGYFLSDFDQAAEIIHRVAAPNLGLQFDTHHAHLITGDIAAAWQRFGPLTRHVQIAGVPDRHEPDDTIIDHPAFFELLDASGYTGCVGADYIPRARTEDGLGWITNGARK